MFRTLQNWLKIVDSSINASHWAIQSPVSNINMPATPKIYPLTWAPFPPVPAPLQWFADYHIQPTL